MLADRPDQLRALVLAEGSALRFECRQGLLDALHDELESLAGGVDAHLAIDETRRVSSSDDGGQEDAHRTLEAVEPVRLEDQPGGRQVQLAADSFAVLHPDQAHVLVEWETLQAVFSRTNNGVGALCQHAPLAWEQFRVGELHRSETLRVEPYAGTLLYP